MAGCSPSPKSAISSRPSKSIVPPSPRLERRRFWAKRGPRTRTLTLSATSLNRLEIFGKPVFFLQAREKNYWIDVDGVRYWWSRSPGSAISRDRKYHKIKYQLLDESWKLQCERCSLLFSAVRYMNWHICGCFFRCPFLPKMRCNYLHFATVYQLFDHWYKQHRDELQRLARNIILAGCTFVGGGAKQFLNVPQFLLKNDDFGKKSVDRLMRPNPTYPRWPEELPGPSKKLKHPASFPPQNLELKTAEPSTGRIQRPVSLLKSLTVGKNNVASFRKPRANVDRTSVPSHRRRWWRRRQSMRRRRRKFGSNADRNYRL